MDHDSGRDDELDTRRPAVGVVHRDADAAESARANRRWWDGEAPAYYAEHGEFLGDADLLWCPEGLREADAHLLGEVADRDVLEVGCGAAQGARWLVGAGARVTAFDVSYGQLRQARRLDARTGVRVPRLVQADAQSLPFRDAAFDLVVSAFGGDPVRRRLGPGRCARRRGCCVPAAGWCSP